MQHFFVYQGENDLSFSKEKQFDCPTLTNWGLFDYLQVLKSLVKYCKFSYTHLIHNWWFAMGIKKNFYPGNNPHILRFNSMHFCQLWEKCSPTGNRTLVSRVTGGDTHHYTIEDVNTVNRFRCVWFSNLLCIEMDVFYNKCKIMAIYPLNWSTLSLMNEWINDDKDWTNVLMLWFVLNIFCNGKSSPEVRVATSV